MRAGLVFKFKSFLPILLLTVFLTPVTVMAQLDDPTRPPGYSLYTPGGKKKISQRFVLTAIRISDSHRTAEINDRLVEEGSRVNGARVIAISPTAVKLEKEGRVISLRLVKRLEKTVRK